MVRMFGPLKSLTAHGHFQYPYPIDLYGIYPCFHPYGWVYEMRRTWHGMQATARRFVYPPNPNTIYQQANRGKFGSAVAAWQALTPAQKGVYNALKYPPRMSGYNKFLRLYMRGWT